MGKINNFWSSLSGKKKIVIVLVAIAVLAIAFFAFGSEDDVEYVTAKVKKDNLKQTVSEVGTVKAVKEINLSFLQSGKLDNNFVKIGDEVEKGDILTELD